VSRDVSRAPEQEDTTCWAGVMFTWVTHEQYHHQPSSWQPGATDCSAVLWDRRDVKGSKVAGWHLNTYVYTVKTPNKGRIGDNEFSHINVSFVERLSSSQKFKKSNYLRP